MKIRTDFVTNSSSSSFIICFARIDNEEKAKRILEKFNIDALSADEVNRQKYGNDYLGAYWCDALIYGDEEAIEKHPNDKYIIITDYVSADYDEYGNIEYSYDFEKNDAINAITEENGFADIEVAEGAGFDG